MLNVVSLFLVEFIKIVLKVSKKKKLQESYTGTNARHYRFLKNRLYIKNLCVMKVYNLNSIS